MRARARIGKIATCVHRSFSAPGAIAIHCSNTSVTSFLVARDRSGLLLLATLIARTMVFARRALRNKIANSAAPGSLAGPPAEIDEEGFKRRGRRREARGGEEEMHRNSSPHARAISANPAPRTLQRNLHFAKAIVLSLKLREAECKR